FQNRNMAVGFGSETSEMTVAVANASYFDLFDVHPVLGRFFTAREDSLPAGEPVAVLSYAYWQLQYGGRADALGTKIKLGKAGSTVIGVAPEGFTGIQDHEPPVAFVPITAYATSVHANYYKNYNWGWHEIVMRRKPGVSEAQMAADLSRAFVSSWLSLRAMEP